MTSLSLGTLALFVFWILNRLRKIGSRQQGLPPGPPTLPLIGNLHLFPTTRAHLKFTEWAATYGNIYSVKIGSQTAVFISSAKCARECFELNSATTSDRPEMHMLNLVYQGNEMIMGRYGPYWKNLRRAAHHLLSKDACNTHLALQRAGANLMMNAILESPQNIYDHIQRYATSLVLELVFGVHCPTYDDPLIKEHYEIERQTELLIKPGEHPPIDAFPILRYIPERWTRWRSMCRDIRNRQRKYFLNFVDRCLDRIANEKKTGCFMEYLLENGGEYGFNRENTLYFALSLVLAGGDTTATYLQFFVLCMLENPEILAKAQREIDDVIGNDRVPELKDLENLPYVRAIINEVHRYRPIAPTSIPHYTIADIKVAGYLIPKGTTIFMNIWGIGRDPELYEDPDRFWPERFVNSEFGTKPGADTTGCRETPFSFGSGRRICPGVHLASNSIAINVMNVLWAFEINPSKDPDTGLQVPFSTNDTIDGALLSPNRFACDIRPRSSAKVDLIKRELELSRPSFDRFT
ncbi:hypothetical protein QCA50_004155 [Cerrena zonata]|uniref:Cytochrome P450 n=1 Tax=Cerrena zonata TaxID=2478898 RepID=A0AAW0GN59_9APHY